MCTCPMGMCAEVCSLQESARATRGAHQALPVLSRPLINTACSSAGGCTVIFDVPKSWTQQERQSIVWVAVLTRRYRPP
jgi:hypothetical protein